MERIKLIPFLFFTTMFIVSGCEEEPALCDDSFELVIQQTCTFSRNRQTVERIENARGFVELFDVGSMDLVTIRPINLSDNIPTGVAVPCNLPSFKFVEGQEVIFSGNVKEIFPTENIVGPHLELKSLCVCMNK